MNFDKQSKIRSGVGSLLYLVKHYRPDLDNCVRKLSKIMNGCIQKHYDALLRVLKYVYYTDNSGILFEPNIETD